MLESLPNGTSIWRGETKERLEKKTQSKPQRSHKKKLATIRHDNSCRISQSQKQKCLQMILSPHFYALGKMHFLVGAPGEEAETLSGPSGPPSCLLGGSRVLLIHGWSQGLTGSEGSTEGAVTLFQDTPQEDSSKYPTQLAFPCPRHSPS